MFIAAKVENELARVAGPLGDEGQEASRSFSSSACEKDRFIILFLIAKVEVELAGPLEHEGH